MTERLRSNFRPLSSVAELEDWELASSVTSHQPPPVPSLEPTRPSSLAEERGSVLRGGGTEEDCRDIDDRIAHYEHLIEVSKNAVTGPDGTRPHDSLSPTQDDNQ